MSQFAGPVRRRGGDLNVYTGLLCVAAVVLLAGVILLATRNAEHSSEGTEQAAGEGGDEEAYGYGPGGTVESAEFFHGVGADDC